MHILQFSFFLYCCSCCLLLLLVESKTCAKHQNPVNISIGVVIDESSRVGKEQRIAMELAVHDFSHCLNLVLHFKDSHGSSPRSAFAAIDLVNHIEVHAIIGTITLQEAASLSKLQTLKKSNIPIISTSSTPQEVLAPKMLSFIQMSTPITYQMQCIAAIVAHFRWRKVILIHEQRHNFSKSSRLITQLSNSLRFVGASVEHHFAFPRVSSLSNPKPLIEQELKKLKNSSVQVFVVAQSSLEFAVILFEEAKKLGMMEKGYAWIISDEISNLLDSVDLSVLHNMQGVIGLKTNYVDTGERFREFKSRFRRRYEEAYPTDEENSTPSIYSLRAYDAIWTISSALHNSETKIDSTTLVSHISSSNFEGISGKISFKNSLISNKPIFRIVNVMGKSYREVALWSIEFGFLRDLNIDLHREGRRLSSDDVTEELGSIYWPGNKQIVPKGWTIGSNEKPLRIGIPAKCIFKRFVNVTYDPGQNRTLISGFSIEVFEAAVKKLPYELHYVFVPYYGSYDELVVEVHNKRFDAAVGDIVITADRYMYAEFSQPYIESGLAMVVTVKPGLKESKFIALNAFTKKMWILLAVMSMSTGAVIWLSEYSAGNEQFTKTSFLELIGSVLWLSVTILSFSHREHIETSASKLVLAAWICIVFVVGASFTAVLSSMMTVPRLQPSILDIEYLRNTNAVVACDGNAFVDQYLIKDLHFKPGNVRKFYSVDDYPKAFESGDIKAAFFSAAHVKVFLAIYCKGYTTSGPSFKIGGLGSVFPKGSPLTIDISEAILKLTQSGRLNELENNILSFSNCPSSTTKADDMKLGDEPFSGLFQVLGGIIGVTTFIAIFRLVKMHWTSICNFLRKALLMSRIYMWTSFVLTECCSRFGLTLFRGNTVHPNVPRGEMEPNLAAIQLAVNHK
ncbi:hypothetical protein BUALT_Bualt08G0050400 [Buddleja alternifolia]|uniref:Glutamate receptor n=1 Tax=Buddleja alternifolia TaxID=168488 RepID=A0AAV6XEN0_9LAMI|nr:hypothetical protein BUALT_Bualt08G0050400 [Buddleja alternifolia]